MQQTFNNRHIWNVAYPIFLGLLAQNIINVTDTAFLGHVGETALGGAAMGGLLYICIYTMAFGFSIGSQILIARRNGEGNYHMIGEIMWQGSAFSFAMAVIMLVLMFMFAEPMIRLFVNSESVYNATYEFFIWRMWGLLFSFINVMFRALYIGITNTKVLTMNAIVMALVNVFLDYAMIFGKCGFPEMGIKGAAIASVIAEASSLVFYIIYTRCKIDIGKYRLNRIGRFRPSIVLRILHRHRASGRTPAGHSQHSAERICGAAHTGAVARHHSQHAHKQPHRRRRRGRRDETDEKDIAHVAVHNPGSHSACPDIPTCDTVGLHQRQHAHKRIHPIAVRGVRSHNPGLVLVRLLQRHLRHGQHKGRTLHRTDSADRLRRLCHHDRHGAAQTGRDMLHHRNHLLPAHVRPQHTIPQESQMAKQEHLTKAAP